MKIEWETIDEFHQRAKVYGGWLVKAYTERLRTFESLNVKYCNAMCFVPDDNHVWSIKE